MRVKDKTQAYPTDTTVLLGSGDDDADHCYTVHDVRETIGDTVKRELSNDVAAMKTELAEEVETARAEVSTNLAASRVLASDVAQAKTDVESDLQEVQTLAAQVRQNTADVSQAKTTLDENVAAMSAQVDAHTQSVTQMQAELARNHSVAVTLYDTRENLPATIDFAKGIVAKIGESAYCIDTKKWYRCTAVDTETLAITWEEFDGLGTKLIAGKGISIDAATGAINANTNTYRGTKEAWEALSVAEKITYTDVDFTDYDGDGELDARIEALEENATYEEIPTSAITLSSVNSYTLTKTAQKIFAHSIGGGYYEINGVITASVKVPATITEADCNIRLAWTGYTPQSMVVQLTMQGNIGSYTEHTSYNGTDNYIRFMGGSWAAGSSVVVWIKLSGVVLKNA